MKKGNLLHLCCMSYIVHQIYAASVHPGEGKVPDFSSAGQHRLASRKVPLLRERERRETQAGNKQEWIITAGMLRLVRLEDQTNYLTSSAAPLTTSVTADSSNCEVYGQRPPAGNRKADDFWMQVISSKCLGMTTAGASQDNLCRNHVI